MFLYKAYITENVTNVISDRRFGAKIKINRFLSMFYHVVFFFFNSNKLEQKAIDSVHMETITIGYSKSRPSVYLNSKLM